MAAVDKAALLAKRGLGTKTVNIEGIGDVVVRGLTRAEVLAMQNRGSVDASVMEQMLVSTAMVEPQMTEAEVAEWQSVAAAGELDPIATAVQDLSGLAVKAVKSEMQRFQ